MNQKRLQPIQVELLISDAWLIANLQNDLLRDSYNNYTGPMTGFVENQFYFDWYYYYKVDDTGIIRMHRDGFWKVDELPVDYTNDWAGVLWFLSHFPEYPEEVVASIQGKDEYSYNGVAVCDGARVVFDEDAANYSLPEWGLARAKYRTRGEELLRFVAKPYTDGSQDGDGSRWLNKLYGDPALNPLPNNYYKTAPLDWYTSILLNRPVTLWKLIWVYHNYYKFWTSSNYNIGSSTNPRWISVVDGYIYIGRSVVEKRSVSDPTTLIATLGGGANTYIYVRKHLEKTFLYRSTWGADIRRTDLSTFNTSTSINALAWGASGQTQRMAFDWDYWYVCVNWISVWWWVTKFNATDTDFSIIWRTAQAIWPTYTDNLVSDCVIVWNNIYAVGSNSSSPNLYIFNKNTLTLDNVHILWTAWDMQNIKYDNWYLYILYTNWRIAKLDINTLAEVWTFTMSWSDAKHLYIEWDYIYSSVYPSIKKIDKNLMVDMARNMDTWHLSDQFVAYENKIYATSQPFNRLYIADYKLPDFNVNGSPYVPWMIIDSNTVTIQVPNQVQLKKMEYVLTRKK